MNSVRIIFGTARKYVKSFLHTFMEKQLMSYVGVIPTLVKNNFVGEDSIIVQDNRGC